MILLVFNSGILAQMSSLQIKRNAYAKVNFSLSVGSKMNDGRHQIASRMAKIGLCDTLELTALDSHSLSRYAILWHKDAVQKTNIDWPVKEDLSVRAHRLLEREMGYPLPLQLKLEKRIPVGSGLGGGSSDAAAMLQSVSALFELDIPLESLANELGSDVPFFLQNSSAIVTGTGDIFEPIQDEMKDVIIISPPCQCSTKKVYEAFDSMQNPKLDIMAVRSGDCFNDLLFAAFEIQPKLKLDFEQCKELIDLPIHLTGSGSSMFAICDNELHANESAEIINQNSNCDAIATTTI